MRCCRCSFFSALKSVIFTFSFEILPAVIINDLFTTYRRHEAARHICAIWRPIYHMKDHSTGRCALGEMCVFVPMWREVENGRKFSPTNPLSPMGKFSLLEWGKGVKT